MSYLPPSLFGSVRVAIAYALSPAMALAIYLLCFELGRPMDHSALCVLAILSLFFGAWLDYRLGDPGSWHPIVGFGHCIHWGEKQLNNGSPLGRRLIGGVYNVSLIVLALVLPLAIEWAFALVLSLQLSDLLRIAVLYLALLFEIIGVFLMLSARTLINEVLGVFLALEDSLEAGREQVARIVGRDTQELSCQEVQTAALETLSENLSDGVVAPLFWWACLGLPGMIAYKMVNTQDSMIGYRNERYENYGKFSALLDDALNWIPARMTAILMLTVEKRWDLFGFVRRFGKAHASPNSGYPEAALAGILNCRFGGTHKYFGKAVYKPYIGEADRPLSMKDAERAISINKRVELCMLCLSALLRIGLISLTYTILS